MFVQQSWSNSPDFPQAGDGVDPIISQATDQRPFYPSAAERASHNGTVGDHRRRRVLLRPLDPSAQAAQFLRRQRGRPRAQPPREPPRTIAPARHLGRGNESAGALRPVRSLGPPTCAAWVARRHCTSSRPSCFRREGRFLSGSCSGRSHSPAADAGADDAHAAVALVRGSTSPTNTSATKHPPGRPRPRSSARSLRCARRRRFRGDADARPSRQPHRAPARSARERSGLLRVHRGAAPFLSAPQCRR